MALLIEVVKRIKKLKMIQIYKTNATYEMTMKKS
jgi:hypothetical protein